MRWVLEDRTAFSRRQRESVKTECGIALLDHARKFEFADSCRQDALAQMLGDDASAGRHDRRNAQEFEHALIFFRRRVGRIEKNELRVRVTRLQPLEPAQYVHSEYFSFATYAERLQIAAEKCRSGRMLFDKYRRARPPAQRFEPPGARSRGEIHEQGTL